MNDTQLRIAMWSGPRNISTAMMRSWGNRPDTFVCDEPLYAHYLATTGLPHPGAAEVIAAGPTDLSEAIAFVLGPTPRGERIFYQKQMTHHLLPNMDRSWIRQLVNCFLIREPREMILSYVKQVPNPTLLDTGYPQQVELFDLVQQWTGKTPPVIDARDVLEQPRRVLGGLCEALGVEFSEDMLHWPAGSRKTDGVWAKHWYREVEKTMGFVPYRPKFAAVPEALRRLVDECGDYYKRLYSHRIV